MGVTNRGIVRQIHLIPHRVLATSLPGLRPFDVHIQVRQEFSAWVMRQPGGFASWQEGWNAWTGATANRAGSIDFHIVCPDCNGRLFSTRRGIPAPCTTCVGRRRVRVHSLALWQSPPAGSAQP